MSKMFIPDLQPMNAVMTSKPATNRVRIVVMVTAVLAFLICVSFIGIDLLNASFTLDTYTHVTTDMQKNAAVVVGDFIDELFGGKD